MDLTYERKNAYKNADEKKLKKIFEYSERYKRFLDNGKTEREVVAETVALAKENGYTEFDFSKDVKAGDKLYYNNRNKGLFLLKAGKANIAENGVRILVAHVDSPRLDLKQVPLFEKADMAYLKTHYYSGIKKYQWLTIPLALHGVIALLLLVSFLFLLQVFVALLNGFVLLLDVSFLLDIRKHCIFA